LNAYIDNQKIILHNIHTTEMDDKDFAAAGQWVDREYWVVAKTKNVLAKQKQRDKSTTTSTIKKRTPPNDSQCRIDSRARVPVPVRMQKEGVHSNLHR
jgi:hypothetical protein